MRSTPMLVLCWLAVSHAASIDASPSAVRKAGPLADLDRFHPLKLLRLGDDQGAPKEPAVPEPTGRTLERRAGSEIIALVFACACTPRLASALQIPMLLAARVLSVAAGPLGLGLHVQVRAAPRRALPTLPIITVLVSPVLVPFGPSPRSSLSSLSQALVASVCLSLEPARTLCYRPKGGGLLSLFPSHPTPPNFYPFFFPFVSAGPLRFRMPLNRASTPEAKGRWPTLPLPFTPLRATLPRPPLCPSIPCPQALFASACLSQSNQRARRAGGQRKAAPAPTCRQPPQRMVVLPPRAVVHMA
jgi:hypothetical protein